MRHAISICIAMVGATLASPAMWGETLAEAIRADALRLKPQIEAAKADASRRAATRPTPLSAELVGGLHRFGFNAARLAAEIDAGGGATDLHCIFRGMAEETDVQLGSVATAATGAQQAAALLRLSGMLRDAAEIAPAAAYANARSANTNAAGTIAQAALGRCPAEIRS